MDAYNQQDEVPKQDMRNDHVENQVNSNVEAANPPLATQRNRPRAFRAAQDQKLMPQEFYVLHGEDVARRIYEFMEQHGSQAMFVSEAKGFLSTLTICQSSNPSKVMVLEGDFQISFLSGLSSLKMMEDGTIQHRTMLTVTVPGQANALIRGVVAGPLIAATRVKIIMGLFDQELKRGRKAPHSGI